MTNDELEVAQRRVDAAISLRRRIKALSQMLPHASEPLKSPALYADKWLRIEHLPGATNHPEMTISFGYVSNSREAKLAAMIVGWMEEHLADLEMELKAL